VSKHHLIAVAAAASLLLAPHLANAQDSVAIAPATTQPAAFAFLSTYFHYDKPDAIVVEETTPTPDQVNFRSRPAQMSAEAMAAEIVATTEPASPKTIQGIDIRRLRFRDTDGDVVTALLCTPAGRPGPFPLAVAVHGLHSNKAQVCGQVSPSLTKKGFAVLAPDMPLHGERPGSPWEVRERKDWLTGLQMHRRAVLDIRQCIDLAGQRPELDVSKGVVMVGYSMGSILDSIVGPLDERVRAMVLMVGGTIDPAQVAPRLRMLPQLAAIDPLLALPQFVGRPLLMLNGRRDEIVTPEMADRLYAAAAEPKTRKWYDSGHRLPDGAYRDAAEWIAQTWEILQHN
jgi:fermentation-respiration switch protein FrsA (DUF1100 family)